ncbi:inositol monophosphatase family protein [Mycolicibacterium sp. 050158]|jgi:myo-inositol-1(or 4)-monophosphatase|uniref:inositol monophosphatase family protein n=1 Tax=Mycolicibacterium sp. 050158 TaxID=3090602 RepID=UPI00299D0220|nr:inositol monophosphatase family protein [Mycolicibacterium sp. 050158]MDX1890640.1 inositol monophosphatase family protein [Mycolicibacterium sp. 050158]
MCCDGAVSDDSDPGALRAVAELLATEAAGFVRRRRTEVFGAGTPSDEISSAVRTKSTPTDPVTIVDTETERLLRARLAELRPGDPIVGEEEGGSAAGHPGAPTWVLDPIDGTVNFVYGIEAYAVSVGVQVDGRSVAGAVANVPTGEVFSAARGAGARVLRDGTSWPLRCNAIDDVSMALVGTGFAYVPEQRKQQAEVLARLLPGVRDVRRVGSCALDLCMVAAGRLDAYYERGVNVWDWAAGALVAEEAGAVLLLPPAGGADEGSELIVAAAPGIAGQFDEALKQAGAY